MCSASGWKDANLGDICTFKYGKSLPQTTRNGGKFSVYGSNGVVGHHDSAITAGKTIVIGRKGSYGEVNYSTEPCWPIDTAYFVDETSTQQDIKWLSYRLANLGLNQLNKAAAVPGLNREDAYRQQLFVPPLPEQRRIAAILDQADALRAKRREALAQLDSLTQSIFIEMFGDPGVNPKNWAVYPAEKFIVSVTNGMTRRRSESEMGNEIVLRLRDVRSGWIDFSDVNRITLLPNEVQKYRVVPDDLLFIRVNGNPDYVGRCAVFNGHSEPVFFNDHIMRVKVEQTKIHRVFLSHFLSGEYGKREIAKYRKTSAGQHTINQDGLGKIEVPVPPIELQTEFSHRLEKIGRQTTAFNASLAELDALFASLQHRAFRGDL